VARRGQGQTTVAFSAALTIIKNHEAGFVARGGFIVATGEFGSLVFLRKQITYPLRLLDAFDAEAEGGQAHREFLFAGERQLLEGGPSESFFKIERARNS
jgi:hypothetical protein